MNISNLPGGDVRAQGLMPTAEVPLRLGIGDAVLVQRAFNSDPILQKLVVQNAGVPAVLPSALPVIRDRLARIGVKS